LNITTNKNSQSSRFGELCRIQNDLYAVNFGANAKLLKKRAPTEKSSAYKKESYNQNINLVAQSIRGFLDLSAKYRSNLKEAYKQLDASQSLEGMLEKEKLDYGYKVFKTFFRNELSKYVGVVGSCGNAKKNMLKLKDEYIKMYENFAATDGAKEKMPEVEFIDSVFDALKIGSLENSKDMLKATMILNFAKVNGLFGQGYEHPYSFNRT
jgi:hypothetical protein